jgi:hypothetical protein
MTDLSRLPLGGFPPRPALIDRIMSAELDCFGVTAREPWQALELIEKCRQVPRKAHPHRGSERSSASHGEQGDRESFESAINHYAAPSWFFRRFVANDHHTADAASRGVAARTSTQTETASMRLDRVKLALLATLSTLAFATSASAETPYDGLWRVTVVTNTGSCEPSTNASVTIADGVIRGGSEVTGKVNRDGFVKVSLGAAYAHGQLDGNTGSGKWSAASGGAPCSGLWQASRM